MNYKYYCDICERYYKSQQSFCNHKKKFHPNNPPKSAKITPMFAKITPKSAKNKDILCSYCNKKFKRNDYLKKHIDLNRCKEKKLQDIENKILKEKYKMMEEKYGEQIKIMSKKLEDLINEKGKIHYKTLQKINNQNNINTQNNNTQNNNINIIGFTKEDLMGLFSENEKLNILKKNFNSLSYIIEYTHFNEKYPQMNNIKITNLNNNIAHVYDSKKNKFIATTKDKMISDLIINRMYDIEEFEGEVMEKMSEREREIIKKMLERFYDDEETFINNKKEDIKFLVYNNSIEL